MKCKLPPGQRVYEPGQYLCDLCETTFAFESGEMACPQCGNADPEEIVAVYMEEDEEEEAMYSDADFGQGD